MTQIKLTQLTKMVDGEQLFQTTELTAHDGDVVGIIGNNGAGKSTLMRLISGDDQEFTGQRLVSTKVTLVKQVNPLQDRSGGQETLFILREALAKRPAILILDEPTANLDEKHQDWLIDQVHQYHGVLLVVSHDSHFLTKTATKIWAVNQHQFTEFEGGFKAYQTNHRQQISRQQHEYERQHRQEKELKQAVEKRHQKAQRIRKGSRNMGRIERANTKSIREQNAGKMERGAKALLDRSQRQTTVNKPFQAAPIKLVQADFPPFTGKTVLSASSLTLQRNHQVLLKQVTFAVKPGERVALQGTNGSGKSTLIEAILQHAPHTQLSNHARVGYFKQDITQLDDTLSVWQLLSRVSVLGNDRTRQIAGAFGINARFYDRLIGQLSGGERVKLQVLSVITSESNVLVLDEPTNFLDVGALNALAAYLIQYPGTVVFVSHDADFRQRVATRTLVIKHQQLVDPNRTVTRAAAPSQLPLLQLRYDQMMLDPFAKSDDLRQLRQQIDQLKEKS